MHEHWRYFISLDEDLQELSRYIEIAEDNMQTYSVELVRLLLAACSEVDVVSKLLCAQDLAAGNQRPDIEYYRKILTKKYPLFHSMVITIPRYGLQRTPWLTWGEGKNPVWWQRHNAVKHARHLSFRDANLENTLNALAGLFAMVLYLYQPELYAEKLAPWPEMLSLARVPEIIVEGRYHLPDFPNQRPGDDVIELMNQGIFSHSTSPQPAVGSTPDPA